MQQQAMAFHLLFLLVIVRACCISSSYTSASAARIPFPESLKVDLAGSANHSRFVKAPQHTGSTSFKTSIFAGPGQFLTSLSIGTPPVTFTGIVDTGSDLVWRQCKPCRKCYPQADGGATIFDPSKSSTYTKASCKDPLCDAAGGTCSNRTCKYRSSYDDPPAYTRGDLSLDTLTISDAAGSPRRLPRFAFGCSHSSHGPYNFAGSGGIVGLGQGPLSLPSQLNVRKFSYCLQKSTTADSSPSLTSPLFLGPGASLGGGAHNVQSTTMLYDTTVYSVLLKGISVGGQRLNISPTIFRKGGTIVDSGTTFTTLAPPAFHAVRKAFRSRISLPRAQGSSPRNLSLCYNSTGPVPSLAFHFDGACLILPSQNYFITIEGLFCLAILKSGNSLSIFGNVQQQNYHILYDLDARLISFKPAACSQVKAYIAS